MIGYLFNIKIEDLLLDELLKTADKAGIPFCAISIDSMKQMLCGQQAEVLVGQDGNIIKSTSPLPPIIDCTFPVTSSLAVKNYGKEFIYELRKKSHVCSQRTVTKRHFPAFLYKNGLFEHAIPTFEVKTFEELQRGMIMYPDAILKPSGGRMGNMIYHLRTGSSGDIRLIVGENAEVFDEERFAVYSNKLQEGIMGYGLLQPRMDFRLDDKHAFECKLLRHRDENGDWKDVGTYAMVGGNDTVANISKGGSFADVCECLKKIAGENADEVYDRVLELGLDVAKGIEDIYGLNAYCLGIDIAIERSTLQPYVIEANTYPNSKRFTPTIAEKRLSYYKYLGKVLGIT